MNASRPALPEKTLAAWSRTARPVRLTAVATTSRSREVDDHAIADDDTDPVNDLLFGCSAAMLMAMPLILATAALIG